MLLSSFSVVNFPYEVSEVICHWSDRVCLGRHQQGRDGRHAGASLVADEEAALLVNVLKSRDVSRGKQRFGDLPFSFVALQKTLRDGHFKALQGKLELLERLCRALQKERNDLNNRLSLLQKEGGQEVPAPSEESPVQEEQEVLPDSLEREDVHQPHRPPEMPPAAQVEQ